MNKQDKASVPSDFSEFLVPETQKVRENPFLVVTETNTHTGRHDHTSTYCDKCNTLQFLSISHSFDSGDPDTINTLIILSLFKSYFEGYINPKTQYIFAAY